MANINNVHDKFTRSMLVQLDTAKAFLNELLPANIRDLLDISTLEVTPNSYITDQLSEQFSDVVYRVQTKNNKTCEVAILIEHKSYVDKFVSVQLLGYIHQAYAEKIKNKEELIPIIPIVYYHGKDKWQVASIRELISADYDSDLLAFVPEFKHIFVNLQSKEEKEILQLQHKLLKAMLLLQKVIGNKEKELKNISLIFTTLGEIGVRNYYIQFFVYLLSVSNSNDEELLEEIKKLPQGIKTDIMTAYDQIIEKGIEQGIEQGIYKGDKDRMIKTILKGYENGATIDFLAIQNETSTEEVRSILRKHGKST